MEPINRCLREHCTFWQQLLATIWKAGWRSLSLLVGSLFLYQSATAQLNAGFSATPTSGCAPIRVVFQDQSTGSPTGWKWDLGNGIITTQQNPSTTYFDPGVYTIRLVVYRGTDSSVIVRNNYVSVYPVPTAEFSATPLQGCFPLNVAFRDLSSTPSGTITSWQWDFGDGNISTQQHPTHTYLIAGVFNVTLTVRNNNGCSRTVSKLNLVRVSQGVIANFTSTTPQTCLLPVTVTFSNISTGAVSSYLWDFGDGQTATSSNPVHTYTTAGLYTVRLIVTSASGCTDTLVRTNLIRAGLVTAGFTSPATICANTGFTLQNTSAPDNSLISTTWDFGDGTTSTELSPVKSYATPGTYTIKLLANFGLCKDTISKTIVVSPKPTAAFSGTNLGACRPPLTTSFTNSSTGGTIVSWNFGDGTTSTASNPTHTYTSTGSYTVTLIVENATGCRDTLTRPAYVAIAPPEIIRINPGQFRGCLPQTVNFSADVQSPDPVVSYEWDFGDGTTSTAATPSHLYAVQGAYTIRLRVTTATGCTDTISYAPGVIVGEKPKAAFTANPLVACAEDNIQFTDLSIAPLPDSWEWYFGDGGTSTEQNPQHAYSDTGHFNVTLIVYHSGCSDTLVIPNYIYIKPPIARFLDSFECVNQRLRFFKDESIGAVTYNWSFGDGNTATIPSPNHLYADTGRYTVTLRVSDGTCQHTMEKLIYVLNERAGFNVADSLGCGSIVKEFTATSRPWNIQNYIWSFGDGLVVTDSSGPFIRHRYDTAGLYTVKLKITDLNNCSDSISRPINISQLGPRARFSAYQRVCIRNTATFTDSSRADAANPIRQWIWNFGDNTGWQTFTAPPFTHVYTTGGLYTVSLVVVDAAGCRDSLVRPGNIRVSDPRALFSASDTIVCPNTPVTFIDTSRGFISTRLWNFGDGGTGTGSPVQHLYPATGLYNVKLKVIDFIGCTDSITKPQYIRVENAMARFSQSDSFTTCPPLLVTFTNQTANLFQSFWDFGDDNTSSLHNPSHTYTESGIFTVKLVVTGNGGCKDSTTKQIRILGPTGNFSYTPRLGCSPLQVQFNTNSQNAYFFTFDFNDGTTQFSNNAGTIHSYVLQGDYLPRVILEDSLGCKLPINGTDTIHVKGIRAAIRTLPAYLFCDATTIQFRDSVVTNDVIQGYEWQFGDGNTATVAQPTHTYTSPGLYTVVLKVTTVTGCTSIDTLKIPIRVVASPQLNITGSSTGCVPQVIQFTSQWLNADTSAMQWNWDFDNGQTAALQNPPAVTYTATGNYTVRLIGRNSSGCADTVLHPIAIFPLPAIQSGPDTLICRGQPARLRATGGTSYVWNSHPSLSCTSCANPIALPDTTRLYTVRGTDANGCQNIDSVLVRVKQPFVLRVNPGDTICRGQSFQLRAAGAENYLWQPARFLSATTIPNPIARPDSTITYRIVGYDSVGCFRDTGFVTVRVYPIPTVDVIENQVILSVGDPVQLHSTASSDVNRWRWSPTLNLTCTDCPNPIAQPRQNISYTLTVSNEGHCTAQDRVNITLLCRESNIYVPNTFSPNNDGANDVFYPRGKGLFSVKSMRIFSRWGELVFEKTNFLPNDPTAGWDGKHKGIALTPDVYVYVMEVICDNNALYNVKGNVTLLK